MLKINKFFIPKFIAALSIHYVKVHVQFATIRLNRFSRLARICRRLSLAKAISSNIGQIWLIDSIEVNYALLLRIFILHHLVSHHRCQLRLIVRSRSHHFLSRFRLKFAATATVAKKTKDHEIFFSNHCKISINSKISRYLSEPRTRRN